MEVVIVIVLVLTLPIGGIASGTHYQTPHLVVGSTNSLGLYWKHIDYYGYCAVYVAWGISYSN